MFFYLKWSKLQFSTQRLEVYDGFVMFSQATNLLLFLQSATNLLKFHKVYKIPYDIGYGKEAGKIWDIFILGEF